MGEGNYRVSAKKAGPFGSLNNRWFRLKNDKSKNPGIYLARVNKWRLDKLKDTCGKDKVVLETETLASKYTEVDENGKYIGDLQMIRKSALPKMEINIPTIKKVKSPSLRSRNFRKIDLGDVSGRRLAESSETPFTSCLLLSAVLLFGVLLGKLVKCRSKPCRREP